MVLRLDRLEGFTNDLVLALAPSAYVSEGLLAEHRFAGLLGDNRLARMDEGSRRIEWPASSVITRYHAPDIGLQN